MIGTLTDQELADRLRELQQQIQDAASELKRRDYTVRANCVNDNYRYRNDVYYPNEKYHIIVCKSKTETTYL